MSKNIIYTCYDCPPGQKPGFVDLHIELAKQYADRIGCDYKVIDNVETKYTPLVFVVYEAYKDFAMSSYDKMLWIDWDILIKQDSPDIFEENNNTYWGDSEEHKFLSSIETITDASEMNIDGERFVKSTFVLTTEAYLLPEYINSAVTNKVSNMKRQVSTSKVNFTEGSAGATDSQVES